MCGPVLVNRRKALLGVAGLAGAACMPRLARSVAPRTRDITLVARSARAPLAGSPYPDTDVWAYDGVLPGPEIRVRQGERLRVRVENRLAEETTVHWHGIRVPNAMDGVPYLTQKPIAPGETFLYEFDCPDAGTYWYHPHQRSFEQVGRGLAGALIVEEVAPPAVDRDVTWVLGDWRLMNDASISGDFGHMRDISHNGRIGNTVTVNGRVRDAFVVRAGERIRLRLINVANARIFGLEFSGLEPSIIAIDGQPVEPHAPESGRVVLGPATRIDLVLDIAGRPGDRYAVIDSFYSVQRYRLLDLAVSNDDPLPARAEKPLARLPSNPLAEPDIRNAERHEVTLSGGMMGGMHSAMMNGRQTDIRTLMHNGLIWAINGVAASGHVHDPLLTFKRGKSYVLRLVNETAWHHPMHLHGHFFRVLSVNGKASSRREWLDTVLLYPREEAEIALVADNPGDWMFHCHILEHQAGGMMGVVRVA
jgi:FtsP/CotA-like multicopper oxidase with cupredoxin domain